MTLTGSVRLFVKRVADRHDLSKFPAHENQEQKRHENEVMLSVSWDARRGDIHSEGPHMVDTAINCARHVKTPKRLAKQLTRI